MALDGPLGKILGFDTSGRSRNLSLLIVLILVVGVVPILRIQWLLDVTIALVLLSSVRAVSVNRRTSIMAWTLAAVPFAGLLLSDFLPSWADTLARVSVTPFFVYAVVVLVAQLMKARSVRSEELYGAASTYLLLGLTWGIIFMMVESIHPGSFSFPDHDEGGGHSLLYFSYITLVTVGYGEITPVSDTARSFAVIEAVMGALFMTILVARLVGLYTAAQSKERDEEPGSEAVDS
jgi:hypothetical protein